MSAVGHSALSRGAMWGLGATLGGTGNNTQSMGNIIVPVRTEPRAYFANERTLLNWMELGSTLAVVGSALTQTGQSFAMQVSMYGLG